jgi:hypothetical protein
VIVPAAQDWLRRLGAVGFLFFLAKGLLWLTLPYLASLALN